MAVIYGPETEDASIGLPPNTKVLKADFNASLVDGLLETKGQRCAWSRASVCPCTSADPQTRSSDPNCPLCKLTPGWTFFRPDGYDPSKLEDIGILDDLQTYLVNREDSPGVVIRALMTSVANSEKGFDRLGQWVFGSFMTTTRHQNKLGFMDRLVALDAQITWSQILHVTTKAGPIAPRFPATKVSFCRTTSTRYIEGAHFELDEQGSLLFASGKRPAQGARLSIHYHHHPQFLVQEHVHAFRDSVRRNKVTEADRETPLGNVQHLPLQALSRFEFLVGQG